MPRRNEWGRCEAEPLGGATCHHRKPAGTKTRKTRTHSATGMVRSGRTRHSERPLRRPLHQAAIKLQRIRHQAYPHTRVTAHHSRGRTSLSRFSALAFFVLNIVTSLVNKIGSSAVSLITSLVSLAAILSLLFMAARRYHDSGKSGVWVLLQAFTNFVALIVSFGALIGAGFSAMGGSESDVKSFGAVAIVAGLILLANTVWAIVWLSLPGKPEKTKYDH